MTWRLCMCGRPVSSGLPGVPSLCTRCLDDLLRRPLVKAYWRLMMRDPAASLLACFDKGGAT